MIADLSAVESVKLSKLKPGVTPLSTHSRMCRFIKEGRLPKTSVRRIQIYLRQPYWEFSLYLLKKEITL